MPRRQPRIFCDEGNNLWRKPKDGTGTLELVDAPTGAHYMTDVAAVVAEYVYGAGPHGEIVRSRKLP